MAQAVAGWFQEFGGEVQFEEVLPGRPNIYGIWRGRSDRWLAVDVHMDTVGVEQMTEAPFDGRIEAGRVYGRGSVDTKATLAVVLALLERMQQSKQRPAANLVVVASMDEESQTHGARAFAQWVRRQKIELAQLAVAEPTMGGPVYGHKGVLRLEFEVYGQATHSSQPELGQNAITAAARVIVALEEEHQRLQTPTPALPLKGGGRNAPSPFQGEGWGGGLGPPKLTTTIIHGGIGENVVPGSCRFYVDRRIVAGERPAEVAVALEKLAQQACPLPVMMKVKVQAEAFLQPPDSPWVNQLAEWSGLAPTTVPYGTNACAYSGLAGECVIIGPGSIDQAHGAVEWVEIAELEKLAGLYAKWWEIQF
jgi:acetylornithine deacetylase/succinyl-diaminopimelate desuccinylase-like protein